MDHSDNFPYISHSLSRAPALTLPELPFVRRELLEVRLDRDRSRAAALAAGTAADEMQRIAADLDRAAEPLRTALRPIEALHTPATWEGRAATASRDRLAGHDERRVAALGSLDHLIGDLEATASRRRRTAEREWGDYLVFANQVQGLEGLLAGTAGSDRIR